MKILITGGAGYIGSHIIKNLLKEGFLVVTIDDLSGGFIWPIEFLRKLYPDKLEFIKGDFGDKEKISEIFFKNNIEAVMHLAAKIDASESLKNPELYHEENYLKSVNLIDAVTSAGCDKFIYSSTAAVYGNPEYLPIDEKHPTNPLNPYGQTKLDFEKYLTRVTNLKYIILRYFNVGGSDPEGNLGRSHINSCDLIENIFKVALGQSEILEIFGSDYKTQDGTPVRDLVHVEDIAYGHILALENIGKFAGEIFNFGSEKGYTVKEIVDKASLIIGKEIPVEISNKRPGDIAVSVASAQKARELLGWIHKYSNLDDIIKTDWVWRNKNPKGYI